MSNTHRQTERWLLGRIKQIGNTIESSGRGEEQYNRFIDSYKYLVKIRPKELQNDPVVTDFFRL